MWWGLLACATETTDPAETSPFSPLDTPRLARRISLDLRGVTPTIAELDRAEAGGLDTLAADWRFDPRHEDHLTDVFAEAWALRVDELRIGPTEFGYDDADLPWFTRALENEPAALMARIAATDRPWSDIVTTRVTLANADLADLVPLVFTDPSDPAEWKEATYTDGRPALGILATSGLWARFSTTRFNYNRTRAATISRELLCTDLLERPVSFVAVTDPAPDALELATRNEPSCIACHAGLDPLASTLFGFWPYDDKDGPELLTYHPEREPLGAALLDAEPGWFGTPIDGVEQLGALIAADPRFDACTVHRAATWLWQREPGPGDVETLAALHARFVTGQRRYSTLVAALLESAEYRAGEYAPGADAALMSSTQTLRSMSAPMLASFVEDLTGFVWTWEGWQQLDADQSGYRVLAGGVDGATVRRPATDPSVSRSLVIKRLAQAAAATVVPHDLAAAADERRLLGSGELDVAPDAAALAGQLSVLHRRITGVAPDDTRLSGELALYAEAWALGGAEAGWRTVVSALLRDPDAWTY
ncbi:MAG: DUF1585 domain-containing protein [Myxococcales bacterium]|nr:DUF1585 domain-containing protein [Myxococcales bacterium]